MELFFLILSPIASAFLCVWLKNRRMIEYLSVAASAVSLCFAVLIALQVSRRGLYQVSEFFSLDPFACIVVLLAAFVGFFSVLYAVGYLRAETAKGIIGFRRVRQCFVLMSLFIAAMFLGAFSTNPILTWIFIEATTLSTAFLISFYNKPSALEAAWKYLVLNSVGLLLGFFGTLLYFGSVMPGHGFVTFESLAWGAENLDPALAKIAFAFILVGYGTKIGLVPMHAWKPDAYSKAPAPVVALLSGALINVAFLAMLRFRTITDIAAGPEFSRILLIGVGLISICFATFMIFGQKNYKRLLAYSSIEHAGIMALGFGFGGVGVFGAILHMVYHALVKSSLFLSAGNLFLKYSSSRIKNVRGSVAAAPFMSVTFIAGLLAIIGVPPFGLFLTKFFIAAAGMENALWAIVFFLPCMAIVFAGVLRQMHSMAFGEIPEGITKGEMNFWLVLPPLVLLAAVLVLSVWIPPFIATLINLILLPF
ncbi:MAG: hypothetical protein A3E07_03665 [Candidatus Wildermuthbacteria bacterium RIFCSPHIGHO2_12_FULL_45_9]|uniref:NADH:quinone oxidoreductase/Mrp antiporter transmembrane domain-containing protein n=1 Tax=Candidatus Wildermuthbacteria bacterium RIFCSPHIGHO2_02_FULL_45_25 TaxID=1802450 RepID=A0A1G2R1T9_9BACT|nr:MAG: hypothetical protein A3C04_03450 [Candidatus Wildermuthbacteria bacterium RIFCSPHIGHO2_02_FULL_45_25]OHA72419.1 MAG: hypothetical protein A3E07_03665 [Candidatus Wildermuthbacteria bacterium RIFCSPHIGHO2_12_FULL_45_9]